MVEREVTFKIYLSGDHPPLSGEYFLVVPLARFLEGVILKWASMGYNISRMARDSGSSIPTVRKYLRQAQKRKLECKKSHLPT